MLRLPRKGRKMEETKMANKAELKGQNEQAKWYRAMFNLPGMEDDGKGPFDGFSNGDNWNGYETPRLTKQAALALVKAFNEHLPGSAEYVKATDTFRVCASGDTTLAEQETEPEAERMVDEYAGEVHMVDGATLTLYAIGSYGWTWGESRMGFYKCHSCDLWLRGSGKAAHLAEKHPGKEAFGAFAFLGFPAQIKTEEESPPSPEPKATTGNKAYVPVTAIKPSDPAKPYILGVAVEGEAGYHPTDYPGVATYDEAATWADELNKRLGLTSKRAAQIIASTMRGTN